MSEPEEEEERERRKKVAEITTPNPIKDYLFRKGKNSMTIIVIPNPQNVKRMKPDIDHMSKWRNYKKFNKNNLSKREKKRALILVEKQDRKKAGYQYSFSQDEECNCRCKIFCTIIWPANLAFSMRKKKTHDDCLTQWEHQVMLTILLEYSLNHSEPPIVSVDLHHRFETNHRMNRLGMNEFPWNEMKQSESSRDMRGEIIFLLYSLYPLNGLSGVTMLIK